MWDDVRVYLRLIPRGDTNPFTMVELPCPDFLLLEPTFLGVPLKNYYTRNANFQHKEGQKRNRFPTTVLTISSRMNVFLVQVIKSPGKTLIGLA